MPGIAPRYHEFFCTFPDDAMPSTMISNEPAQILATPPNPQLRALNLLCAMGWQYLPPSACLAKRTSRRQVLLHSTLVEVLQSRRYTHNGQSHLLTPNGIEQIVRELTAVSLQQGLGHANALLYDKLRLGITITEFLPDGKKHHPTIAVIDWQNRKANRFEVCEQFETLASQGKHVRATGLVCFINGIPVALIEAPRHVAEAFDQDESELVELGIARHVQHQQMSEITQLYAYSQLLFSLGQHSGRYATTLSANSLWSHWNEEQFSAEYFHKQLNTPLSVENRSALQAEQSLAIRQQLKRMWAEMQTPTSAECMLMSLLSPQRLLDFLGSFVLFDAKLGKIVARSAQFFAVRAIIDRVTIRNDRGARQGGVIWHTTGAGKLFTMAFLSRALMWHDSLKECRIVVVTERPELEAQLAQNLSSNVHATNQQRKDGDRPKTRSGHDLARRISSGNERIIFTLLHKFQAASNLDLCYNPTHQLIVLVDEGHRSQNHELHLRMRKALPRAGFVAFAGTPLLRKEKDHNAFGPILHAYPTQRALEDQLIVPLLYETRQLEAQIDDASCQRWFARSTLGRPQRHAHALQLGFQRLMASTDGSQQQLRLATITWDIAQHYNTHVKPLGLKAELACATRYEALLYHQLFEQSSLLHTALILSPPEIAEGEPDIDHLAQEVNTWWQQHVATQGDAYEKQVLQSYSQGNGIDLVIVVDRWLEGFEQSINSVLYIDKPLREHDLVHAIARVNRLHDSKQYGLLIDYRGVLATLDTGLPHFRNLDGQQAGFDSGDIDGMLQKIASRYLHLPELQQHLFALFGLPEESDSSLFNETLREALREQLRQMLLPQSSEDDFAHSGDKQRRKNFYQSLEQYANCLHVALSSRSFFSDPSFSEGQLQQYKHSLHFFSQLRQVAQHDAQEEEHFPQLDHLLKVLLAQLDIQSEAIAEDPISDAHMAWSAEKARNESDLVRSRIRKMLAHDLLIDPYAQQIYQNQLNEVQAQLQQHQQTPIQQYQLLHDLEEKMTRRQLSGIPETLSHQPLASSYFGLLRMVLGEAHFASANAAQQSAYVEQALSMEEVVHTALRENTLNFDNAETTIRSKLLPRLFLMLGLDHARKVMDLVLQIARVRREQLTAS